MQPYIPDRKPPMGALLNPYLSINQGFVLDSIMWEGAGLTVEDLSGNRNTGTFVGTAPSWSAGKFGSAIYLPGDDECIDIDTVVNDLAGTTKGTWSIWINSDGAGVQNEEIIAFGDTDVREIIYLENTYQNKIEVTLTDAGSNIWMLRTDDAVIPDKVWTHVALVQDGVSPVIYINGVAVAQTFITDSGRHRWFAVTAGIDNGRIGCRNHNGAGNDRFFEGSLDIPMFWKRDIPAYEIDSIFREPFCGFRWMSIEQLAAYIEKAPPEIKALFMDLSTQLWTIKHAQGLFTKL